MKTLKWFGCYSESWQGEIVPDAFSHPAKYARGLIGRIYDHMLSMGYIVPGDTIGDCFGGVGLGGRDAARHGLTFTGIELELRFNILALENILFWAKKDWCTCGEENQTYLHLLREIILTFGERGQEEQEEKQEGHILQHVMQYDTPKPRQQSHRGSKKENVKKGQPKNGEKESQLEGGQVHAPGWVHSDSGKRPLQDGARLHHGTAPGSQADTGGSGSSQERQQTRQQSRKPGSDDNIGAHEIAPPERDSLQAKNENLRDLPQGLYGQSQSSLVQRALQAREAAAISAKIRRETEGKFCYRCLKMIVPFPIVMQGDSREFLRHVRGIDGVVSSAPFVNSLTDDFSRSLDGKDNSVVATFKRTGKWARRREHGEDYGSTPGQLGAMKEGSLDGVVSSAPFTASVVSLDGNAKHREWWARKRQDSGRNPEAAGGTPGLYGTTPGQLGAMKEGNLDALVTSPVYADVVDGSGEGPGARHDHKFHNGDNATKNSSANEYGRTAGNLGGLVSSAPFEDSLNSTDRDFIENRLLRGSKGSQKTGYGPYASDAQDYGDHPENIGNDSGATFWQAAAEIVAQTYAALKPGAYAAWVTGNYRRNGEVVDFGQQWFDLCQSVGYVGVERITAWKVERRGVQIDIFGNEHSKDVSRVSFFRRLDNAKNPGDEIESEEVWIVRKPPNVL